MAFSGRWGISRSSDGPGGSAGVVARLAPSARPHLLDIPLCQVHAPAAFLARNGIWAAAVLMPAGFFLSSAGRDVVRPNRLIVLLYAGMVSLALGVASLGIGLLTT